MAAARLAFLQRNYNSIFFRALGVLHHSHLTCMSFVIKTRFVDRTLSSAEIALSELTRKTNKTRSVCNGTRVRKRLDKMVPERPGGGGGRYEALRRDRR